LFEPAVTSGKNNASFFLGPDALVLEKAPYEDDEDCGVFGGGVDEVCLYVNTMLVLVLVLSPLTRSVFGWR
jgi:hypothetical protein